MVHFNEENTVEQMVLDTLGGSVGAKMVVEERTSYGSEVKGWRFVLAEELPRQHSDVLVESMVRDALIRLNPEIKTQPDRADEVLYHPAVGAERRLGAGQRAVCRMVAGREVHALRRAREHTPVRLIDFENLSNNDYVVTSQWVYPQITQIAQINADENSKNNLRPSAKSADKHRRFDIVIPVNGIPLAIGEAKAVTWADASQARQPHSDDRGGPHRPGHLNRM